MASAPVVDIDTILHPIAGSSATGANPRLGGSGDSPYRVMKDARIEAGNRERRVLRGEPSDPPDWSPILKHAPQFLAEQCKDLEVASWLIEALVRLHGFGGLRDGFRVARGLVERYWEGLYPPLDTEGPEPLIDRLASLRNLNGEDREGTLIAPINAVSITNGEAYGMLHWEQASSLDLLEEDKRQARIREGQVTLATLQSAVQKTNAAFYRDLTEDLAGCLEEFDGLCTALDAHCTDGNGSVASPPSSRIREALQHCLAVVQVLAADKLQQQAEPVGPEPAGANTVAAAKRGVNGESLGESTALKGLRTREDAFEALRRVAQFLRDSEPHSPVVFLIEKAIRWGDMTLPEVLSEMIEESGARTAAFKLAGIPAAVDQGA